MHVLVTESHFGDSDAVTAALRASGIRVSRCHDRVGECQVLSPGGRCPLDDLTGAAELVVDVRGTDDELTAREYGAVCAVRARRPLWLVGVDPYVPAEIPAGLRDVAVVGTQEELLTHCRRRAARARPGSFGWLRRPPDQPAAEPPTDPGTDIPPVRAVAG